jgi:hypothetical protein
MYQASSLISTSLVVPIMSLRIGSLGDHQFLYTLRELVVKNGPASPFQQILAWLAKGGDYFTAASVALDLLQDGDTLFHLWKNAEMVDEQEEESKLDGLLDGIIPIKLVEKNDIDSSTNDVYIVHLADMTVGCLIKGGADMAGTLRLFLKENRFYDPARACLMLAATTARMLGDKCHDGEQLRSDSMLWPTECLLQIGIARDYLETVLLLLNATIPDELRNRQDTDEKREFPGTSLGMTKNLVAMIISSNPAAIDILLEMVDEKSGEGYWKSLNNETQLELSLIEADSSFPLIQNPEIRAWAREELNLCLKKDTTLPTIWLQRLTKACLINAGCELTDFKMDEELTEPRAGYDSSEVASSSSGSALSRTGRGESLNFEDDDGWNNLKMEMVETRNSLVPSSEGYSLDFDLLIPCLLLLQTRNDHWLPKDWLQHERSPHVSTQALLEAACYLAGRRQNSPVVITATKKDDPTDEKPFLFADFDSSTAMKQCYLAGNVVAGANLIGGKNGFVLHLCQMLHENVGLSVADAERLVVSDNLDLRLIESSAVEWSSFELTDSHRKLLLLLDEHVLSLKTFGEFETTHIRGRVDPVFVARSIFRSWLSLSYGDKKAASNWLSQWLSRRLELGPYRPDVSAKSKNGVAATCRHRLACAAIARSLIWPSSNIGSFVGESEEGESPPALAVIMEMEMKFLIEVCEACVGLVESVPPRAVQEEMKLLVET